MPPTLLSLPGGAFRPLAYLAIWLGLLFSGLATGPPLSAASATKSFRIPAGDAAETLELFAEQSSEQIVYPPRDVRGVRTNPISGELVPLVALRRMLAGTPLNALYDPETGAMAVTRVSPREPSTSSPSTDSLYRHHHPPDMTKPSLLSLLITLFGFAVESNHSTQARAATASPVASAGFGIVEGRVFNPATGEYLRNAEVRLEGTNTFAVTAADGSYRLSGVPAGHAALVVVYTGYQSATARLNVPVDATIRQDFDLVIAEGGGVIDLGKYTVSATREGTAKALMNQRASMTIKNVIASDTFGDLVEGNIAEALQYLPGMEISYDGADPLSFNVRGMPSRYSALLIDGVRATAYTGNRGPSLTQYAANAADTIEFDRTNSADMDADAPAGSVNLKSKSAFQRRGRHFAYQVYAMVNSYQFVLGKTAGPNDGNTHKTLPGVVLDYSDTFLDGKLGVVVNLSDVTSSNEQAIMTNTYNTASTSASPAPVVVTRIGYTNGPKINRRQGGGLNLEYKISPRALLALRTNINAELTQIYNRQFNLTTSRATMGLNSDATTMVANPTTNNATRFNIAGQTTVRQRSGHILAPSFTYEGTKLALDATLSYGRMGAYLRNSRGDGTGPHDTADLRQVNLQLYGVGWTATRSSPADPTWTFRQTAGPDIYDDLDAWRATSTTNNMNRLPVERTTKNLVGQVNLKFTPDWPASTYFKTGVKAIKNEFFGFDRTYSFTYVGPSGDRLEAELPLSPYPFEFPRGGNLFTDGRIPVPDRAKLGGLLISNPEYFIANPADATSTANLYADRYAKEHLDAAYVMASSRLGKLSLQAGVRYERTKTSAQIYERGSPQIRSGEFDDVFFSGAGRYRFSNNLMAIASFSQSIQRANLSSKTALATINDDTMIGTLPNPDLLPEHGNNYSTRLEYYFEPVGVVSAGVFMMDIKNLIYSTSGIPAEEIGLGDAYPGYLFSTQRNAGNFKVKGFELEYSQQLSFLPGIWRGLGIFGNYAQSDRSNPALVYNVARSTLSGGVSFRYRGLNAALRASHTPDTDISATAFREARTMLNLSASYQLTARTSLFLVGRNILNAPIQEWRRDLPGHLSRTWRFGSNWTVGVKGVF